MMPATRGPIGAVPAKQERNLRWLAILGATALLAGAAGYFAGGSRSGAFVVTGNAQSGIGQVSAQAPDGIWYSIPVDGIFWTDSKGSLHDNGRAECLPPASKTGAVKFAAVEWKVEGVAGRSVVWVSCRS